MDDTTATPPRLGPAGLRSWLRSPVTLTLPGWAVAAGALALALLILVALD